MNTACAGIDEQEKIVETGTKWLIYELNEERTGYKVSLPQGGCPETEVVIPSTFNGLPVLEIGDFSSGSNIVSLQIGDNVESVNDNAFEHCGSLRLITVPNSLIFIGEDAFRGCDSLKGVYYYGNANNWAQITFANYCANPLYYAEKLYINNQEATEIVIDRATIISDYAFYNCSSLESVTIGDNVIMIGCYAFYNCSSITNVIFESPTGWKYCVNKTDTIGTIIYSNILSNSSVVGPYLTSTYSEYYWKRG